MFDFDRAFKEAQEDLKNSRLFLLLLGSSGNGKSYAQGTFGCKTLYLYTEGESHGPKSAKMEGKDNIHPICLNLENGKELSADESIKRLFSILDNAEYIKKSGFKAIALDGLSELESLIRDSTKFRTMTTTDSGKHNGFAEAGATLFQLKEIISKLKRVQRECGVHICATEILSVKELSPEGMILDSTPQLIGYSVATGVVQQFDDVMIIGKMQKKDKISYRFQLLAEATKVSADSVTKEIKKTFNFSPRLTGVDILALPPTLEANLSELIKLKEGK